MSTKNKFLAAASKLFNEAARLRRAAQAAADLGLDRAGDAQLLEDDVATVAGWREHLELEVREICNNT